MQDVPLKCIHISKFIQFICAFGSAYFIFCKVDQISSPTNMVMKGSIQYTIFMQMDW